MLSAMSYAVDYYQIQGYMWAKLMTAMEKDKKCRRRVGKCKRENEKREEIES